MTAPLRFVSDCLLLDKGTDKYKFSTEYYNVCPQNGGNLPLALGKLILESYRSKNFLVTSYRGKPQEELLTYLENYVFPTDRNGLTHQRPDTAVKSGDFGEVLMARLVVEAHGLEIPFEKMMWKMRNDRSSFCTDIFAHNSKMPISELIYYEVKVRQNLQKKASGSRSGTFFVGVIAHDSLAKDANAPTEQIADLLRRHLFEQSESLESAGNAAEAAATRDKAMLYGGIVDSPGNYSRYYGISLVLDKDNAFSKDIFDELENLPPEIRPIRVSAILVPNLGNLITESFKSAFNQAVILVSGGAQ